MKQYSIEMRQFLNLLEKISFVSSDKESDDEEETSLEEIVDDVISSVRRRLSSGHATTTMKLRKEALYKIYCSDRTVNGSSNKDMRRHSSIGIESAITDKNFLSVSETKHQRRSEGSLWDILRNKVLSKTQVSGESVSESVARKVAERKNEIKHLTRPETVKLMRLKYNLDKKSG